MNVEKVSAWIKIFIEFYSQPNSLSGFYRKDHLRKHTRSHIARRVKSEMTSQNATNGANPQSGLAMHPNS